MPMNIASLMKATIHNNAKKLLSAQYTVTTIGNTTKLTPRKSEYNKQQTEKETSSEWVDPYTKLDNKTNQYKVIKGYWREVKKPVKTEKKSIMGGTTSQFPSMSAKEKVSYILRGKAR